MAKKVNVLLQLHDKMTKPLKAVGEQTDDAKKKLKQATNAVKAYGNRANSVFTGVAKKIALATAKAGIFATSMAGLGSVAGAAKLGFSEAFDLEGYKMQLETATKDTKKASEIMTYAIDLANKTPFEGGTLVEGASKFEAMGMSAKKWLTLTGDMAAATNKDFDQATEALIDAQTGELERLKEFGITKAMITKQAEKMFTKQQVVNNQGQIVNQEKFNEALIALMKEKYTGGMEKQATTIKGMWSTITGVTKSGLSTIVGMGTDGNIRKGSALSYLASGIGALSKKIQELQNNGGLDKIAAKFDAFAAKIAAHKDMIINGLQTAWTVVKTVFSGISTVMGWAIQHSNILIQILAGVVSAFAAFNVLNTAATALKSVASAMQLVKDAGGMLNIAKNLTSPLGIAVLAIGAAVTAGMLLYKNWDKIKAKAVQIGSAIKRMFTDIKNALVNTFNSAKTKLNSVFNWIKKKLENIPFVGKIFGAMNDADVNIGASHHALGTPYFSGGLTHINERGGEIVNLPNGTQIIPHDVSRETINNHNGKSVVVNLTIQGNVIGNREYMERTGEYVANKLLEVL